MVMPLFVAIAVLSTAIVLGAVLWPLRRQSRGIAITMAVALAVATFALYRMVGTPAALQAGSTAAPATLDEAIHQLEQALQRAPGQAEGWALLGRSYAAQGRLADAASAYAKAVALAPSQPDLLVDAAQARASAEPQKRFDAQARDWLQRALTLQPRHQRARWFTGIAQRQQGQAAAAAATWESLLPDVDAATQASLRVQVDAARTDAGLPPLPSDNAQVDAAAGRAPTLLRVRIELAPELRARLTAASTLFVIARQANGAPMPVAAKRVPARDFPLTVELGDGDSPMPTLPLSQAGSVRLLARIARQGQAERAPGDLESSTLDATPVVAASGPMTQATLRIDHVVETGAP